MVHETTSLFPQYLADGPADPRSLAPGGDETKADKPRLIDYSMGWDEFDDWPYTKRPTYDTSNRKSIWQILTRE